MTSSRRFSTWVVCATIAAVIAMNPEKVRAYTPDSPKVQEMVRKAIAFVEGNYQKDPMHYPKMGGMCMTAMAILKYTGDRDHELVKAAVAKCKSVCRAGVPWEDWFKDNYNVGIALIFLCELDPQLYRYEIETLLDALLRRQQPGGAWGYSGGGRGANDTSITQYAVLGCWMVHRSNIPVPQDSIERVCNWLLRTQAPNGSFGYNPRDPGSYDRVKQDRQTLSLGAAGLGSVYVCGELLGFIDAPRQPGRRRGSLPLYAKSAHNAVHEEAP